MKYQAEFTRTETIVYYVDVEADTIEQAKELAYELYNDADLDELDKREIASNDYLTKIAEY